MEAASSGGGGTRARTEAALCTRACNVLQLSSASFPSGFRLGLMAHSLARALALRKAWAVGPNLARALAPCGAWALDPNLA
eukprot:15472868-Alexandrium_andersonii.AAC.1